MPPIMPVITAGAMGNLRGASNNISAAKGQISANQADTIASIQNPGLFDDQSLILGKTIAMLILGMSHQKFDLWTKILKQEAEQRKGANSLAFITAA